MTSKHIENWKDVYKWWADYFEVNLNEDNLEVIANGLVRNYIKYGFLYCPCKLQRIPENICPCKEFRETKECHCGLFVKKEDI